MLARLTDGRHKKLTPVQHIETPAINCYVWRDDFESSASSDPLRSEKKSYLTAYQGNIISFFFPSNLEKMRDEAHGRAVQSHALRQNEIRYSLDVHVASPIGDVFETMEHNIALLQTSPVV